MQSETLESFQCESCGSRQYGKPYRDDQCYECWEMANNPGEISNTSHTRCPHCKHKQYVEPADDYDLLTDGEHDVQCEECDRTYKITTYISIDFYSPPLEVVPDEAIPDA